MRLLFSMCLFKTLKRLAKMVNCMTNSVCLEPDIMAVLLFKTQRKNFTFNETVGFAMPLPDENLKSMTSKGDVSLRARPQFF